MKAAIFALFLIYSLKISATDVDKRLQNEYRCCREKLKKELDYTDTKKNPQGRSNPWGFFYVL